MNNLDKLDKLDRLDHTDTTPRSQERRARVPSSRATPACLSSLSSGRSLSSGSRFVLPTWRGPASQTLFRCGVGPPYRLPEPRPRK